MWLFVPHRGWHLDGTLVVRAKRIDRHRLDQCFPDKAPRSGELDPSISVEIPVGKVQDPVYRHGLLAAIDTAPSQPSGQHKQDGHYEVAPAEVSSRVCFHLISKAWFISKKNDAPTGQLRWPECGPTLRFGTYIALTNDIETRRSHRRLKELTRCLLKRQIGTGPANPAGILAVATGHPGNRETSWADAVTVIASAA